MCVGCRECTPETDAGQNFGINVHHGCCIQFWNGKIENENKKSLTCPATANPSASKEAASQTCKQIWNAAMDVDPSLAAMDAARVTQNVAAITLNNNRNPDSSSTKKDNGQQQDSFMTLEKEQHHQKELMANQNLMHEKHHHLKETCEIRAKTIIWCIRRKTSSLSKCHLATRNVKPKLKKTFFPY